MTLHTLRPSTPKNRRPAARAAALVLGLTFLTGCGQSVTDATRQTAPASAATPAGQIQNCGRTLAFTSIPSRAVAMTPGQSELLIKLGLADSVVAEAQSKGRELAAELKSTGKVIQLSDKTPPGRESLLGVRPDFVYSPTGYEFTAEQGFASIEQLKKAGAESYVATAGCLERRSSAEVGDLLTDIGNLGAIFGVRDRAAAVQEEARTALNDVSKAVDGKKRPRVLEVFVEGSTISAIGAGIEHDMIHRAGGDNVFSPTDPAFSSFFSAVISPETLTQKNPEAIVFTTLDKAHEQATLAFLRQKFPNVPAVKDNRLIAIDSDEVMPGTWGNIRAVQEIARGLHPAAS
ncbi:ABC transporter substrate-binding protein [Arthrobacter sp. NPDC090010]|uniref:ABC transporter substrate-binding protein n=1 Tax=Arthrobacter sp. NPDC090010 TaxID=3363942 RepID=UPI00382B40C9